MQVLGFLLQTVFFFLIGAALLRAYMNGLRINMSAQPGTFAMALTDWLVKPLRRLLPKAVARARIDTASLLAAVLLALLHALLVSLMMGWWNGAELPVLALLLATVRTVLRIALQAMTLLVFAYVIISWVQPGSYAFGLLSRLVAPLLDPLRRVVPVIGGVDLSAMALLLLLQVGLMALG